MYGRGWKSSGTTIPSPANGESKEGRHTLLAGTMSYYEVIFTNLIPENPRLQFRVAVSTRTFQNFSGGTP